MVTQWSDMQESWNKFPALCMSREMQLLFGYEIPVKSLNYLKEEPVLHSFVDRIKWVSLLDVTKHSQVHVPKKWM